MDYVRFKRKSALPAWPSLLRVATGIVLQSPQPMLLWVGPDLVALYNDAFAARAGSAHPAALGQPAALGFADVWPVLGPPQGIWTDIWPIGEPVVHEPVYRHKGGS